MFAVWNIAETIGNKGDSGKTSSSDDLPVKYGPEGEPRLSASGDSEGDAHGPKWGLSWTYISGFGAQLSVALLLDLMGPNKVTGLQRNEVKRSCPRSNGTIRQKRDRRLPLPISRVRFTFGQFLSNLLPPAYW
jgi:hypothetical protein